jgi:hypothetical protein
MSATDIRLYYRDLSSAGVASRLPCETPADTPPTPQSGSGAWTSVAGGVSHAYIGRLQGGTLWIDFTEFVAVSH